MGQGTRTRVRVETLLYMVLASIAGLIRFSNLGWPPLNDLEASQALRVALSVGQTSAFWADAALNRAVSPAYESLTAPFFAALGAGDAAARLVPAFAGFAIAMAPLLARRTLGTGFTLLYAFLLTTSPVAALAGRTAGGASLAGAAIALAVFALLENQSRRGPAVWIALGVAVASGPSALTGLLTLALAVGIRWVVGRVGAERQDKKAVVDWQAWAPDAWVGAIALLALVTRFGTNFSVSSGFFNSVAAWLQGWGTSAGWPSLNGAAGLILYEPLIVVLGIAGLILSARGKVAGSHPFLGAWVLSSTLVFLAYPAREPVDLLWVVLPLGAHAAGLLRSLFERLADITDRWLMAAMVGILTVLLAFLYLEMARRAIGGAPLGGLPFSMGYVPALLVLGLALTMLALIGLGWSWKMAYLTGALTLAVVCLSGSLSSLWRVNFGQPATSASELLRPHTATSGVVMIRDVLGSISQAQTGQTTAMPVAVLVPPSPALAWSLREFAPFLGEIAVGTAAPAAALTIDTGAAPALPAEYLGQTFTVGERSAWPGVIPSDFLRWLIIRRAPVLDERWVLLVRTDVAGFEPLQATP